MLAPPGYQPQHPSRADNRPWAYQQAWASVNLPEVPVRLLLYDLVAFVFMNLFRRYSLFVAHLAASFRALTP
jgi:hypothetical protein